MPKRSNGRRDEVTAKELAEMGFCEKRVQLAHLYGEHVTPEQRRAMTRGRVAHQRYFEEGSAATADHRCFVSTFVFGSDALEKQLLRAYRDTVLLRRSWGRPVVAACYRAAPRACRIMERSPAAIAGVRWLLRIVVVWCGRTLRVRGRS